MAYVKTSLTLDAAVTRACAKIASSNDVSLAKYLRTLMRKAVEADRRKLKNGRKQA